MVHQQYGQQARYTEHNRKHHQFQRAAIEATEEFRAAFKAHGIDEECKENRLQQGRYGNADLPDQQPHQQRTCYRPEMKLAPSHIT